MLDLFDKTTKDWFAKTLGTPTPVQKLAWEAIASGSDALVSAPTGTGKTLSAFLVFIDRLTALSREGKLKKELHVIYISPLKSLAGDIRENLNRPLFGISELNGKATPDISVAVRTGDTSQAERRRTLKNPPHIFITTPESLFLLLTSESGRTMLKTAEAVIIDELHAMVGSKRGAHLTLSLARLDRLCGKPLQRIGLSATVKPLDKAAAYLSPNPDVKIIAPKMEKAVDIKVTSPVPEKMRVRQTIWNDIAATVYEKCDGARSVIAFVDGRMYAEKLAYSVNLIAGEGFARTHHGCISKEQRLDAENALRKGELRLLCATSSMELGIDVGDIDRVMQIGCPSSVSGLLQRLGRAGHNPGRVSVMHIFPRSAVEGFYCGLTAKTASIGEIEPLKPPRLCFDVLAQHLVSMAAAGGYETDEVMELLPNAYPFREVTREDVEAVLRMLAGDYEHERDLPVRPRVLYDRVNNRVDGDSYGRMLAVSAGGTIPDTGAFTAKTENGVKIGELDEEFVFERQVGYKFLLGSFAWRITNITKDTVTVAQTTSEGAYPPFWRHAWICRRYETARSFGGYIRELAELPDFDNVEKLSEALGDDKLGLGLDEAAAYGAADFLIRQKLATGILPDDRNIIAEYFTDDTGNHQFMLHSIFGRQVNAPLSLLLQEAAQRLIGDVSIFEDDDGVLLVSRSNAAVPRGLISLIVPETAKAVLEALLPRTPIFNMTFRYNAGRALMMGVKSGKRQPLWVQRMRSAEMLDNVIQYPDHPLIRESKRECLEDYWDLAGLEAVLNGIRSGTVKVREVIHNEPSPMTLTLRHKAEFDFLYDYFPSTTGIHKAAQEALNEAIQLKPQAELLAKMTERRRLPDDEKQLHSMLMTEGDIIASEYSLSIDWFEKLTKQGRAFYIEPGLWIAAEHLDEYARAFDGSNPDCDETMLRIARRALRYRGAFDAARLSERYFIPEEKSLTLLNMLCERKNAVCEDGLYYHADLYEQARRETVFERRKHIQTLPAERYAAVTANRVYIPAPPDEQVLTALKELSGLAFPVETWESAILPSRVNNYTPLALDNLLAKGALFWKTETDKTGRMTLSFCLYEDIDWEADISETAQTLEPAELSVYQALRERGAGFAGVLTKAAGLAENKQTLDALNGLAEKGLAHADSFVPVRQWLEREKIAKQPLKRQVGARVLALNAGRWEITRPLKTIGVEEQIERAFDKTVILCRETAQAFGLPWGEALERLRVWEYTGRARRGYFINGLSGAQFIRERDYTAVMYELENPLSDLLWLAANDPFQAWGGVLPHENGRNFDRSAGSAVALKQGVPVALFEGKGKTLKAFGFDDLEEALVIFAKLFKKRRLFGGKRKIVVKSYPPEAKRALETAGFIRVMMDYELY